MPQIGPTVQSSPSPHAFSSAKTTPEGGHSYFGPWKGVCEGESSVPCVQSGPCIILKWWQWTCGSHEFSVKFSLALRCVSEREIMYWIHSAFLKKSIPPHSLLYYSPHLTWVWSHNDQHMFLVVRVDPPFFLTNWKSGWIQPVELYSQKCCRNLKNKSRPVLLCMHTYIKRFGHITQVFGHNNDFSTAPFTVIQHGLKMLQTPTPISPQTSWCVLEDSGPFGVSRLWVFIGLTLPTGMGDDHFVGQCLETVVNDYHFEGLIGWQVPKGTFWLEKIGKKSPFLIRATIGSGHQILSHSLSSSHASPTPCRLNPIMWGEKITWLPVSMGPWGDQASQNIVSLAFHLSGPSDHPCQTELPEHQTKCGSSQYSTQT